MDRLLIIYNYINLQAISKIADGDFYCYNNLSNMLCRIVINNILCLLCNRKMYFLCKV